MKKIFPFIAFVGFGGMLLASGLLAQSSMKAKEMGQMKMMYDPSTVETIKGEVVSVDSVKMSESMMKMMGTGKGMGMTGTPYGIHISVKTDKETIPVHLGPAWFVSKQETKILVNDKIEVHGSRIMYEEKPGLCAAEVKKGTNVLNFRNEDGTPLWSGKDMPMK